ncbi:hypothetical protein G5V59_15870 [Nocardioides sp. W3-2-3]|uniref:hypothetical protein n=1 Tax=Nocardioides convexus TaxID=2712224 RepID=UPI002418B6BC|nr:hypothetical protein [Nocardioides convexus]NHA00900.1 hypothetical protein [Nocardioides convexus]
MDRARRGRGLAEGEDGEHPAVEVRRRDQPERVEDPSAGLLRRAEGQPDLAADGRVGLPVRDQPGAPGAPRCPSRSSRLVAAM